MAITLTERAAKHVQAFLAKRVALGLRLAVKTSGCSGMAYALEYALEQEQEDLRFESHGVTVLIDPKATMFILGTEMDFVEEKLQNGFVFRNPNEKGRCGCGESFTV